MVEKVDKVLIEQFRDYEIFYDKQNCIFIADKEKLKLHFSGRTLWDVKNQIRESVSESVDKVVFIKSGYWDKGMQKVRLLTRNKATKSVRYEVLADSEVNYEVGKIEEGEDVKAYEVDEHNTQIFANLVQLRKEIEALEKKQQEQVKQIR